MKKVITYGSFDLFHEGHFRLLERAKKLGDYLIVGVTTEQYDESRGKLNIVDPLNERIENVRKTGLADEIIVEDHIGQKVEDVQKYGIDVFTVGSDWVGAFDYLKEFCEVVYLERTKNISSTLMRTRQHPIIRIGIIGTGRIAERFVPEARYVSGVIVQSVYNPHEAHAKRFAEQFELAFYTSDLELFWEKVDAVYIASPHETPCDYTREALKQKKHVLCEKPMAMSLEECGAMVETARQTDRVLMIAQNQRLNQAHQLVRSLVAQGEIGRLLAFQLTFGHSGPENWTGQPDPWFFRKNSAGLGALGDLGVHKIDLLRYLTGDEVSQVAAMTGTLDKRLADGSPADVEDNACLLLRMCSGAVGTIRASWTFYGQEDNSTVLYGTRGSIHVYTDPARAVVVRNRDGTERAFTERNMATNAQQLEGKGENTGVIDAFIRAILSGGPSCADGEDVLKTMRVVFAAEQAAREQKTIVLTPAAQAGRPAL